MKMIKYELLILILLIGVNSNYILYNTDIDQYSNKRFDCLYVYLIEDGKESGKEYIQNDHLIPYCRRADNDQNEEDIFNPIKENIENIKSLKELKKLNISSSELLKWFSPIDLVEKYEMNINNDEMF